MPDVHATKVKMTQVWKENKAIPVTVLRFRGAAAEKPLFEALKDGDLVRLSSLSKGKGFQGVVKRHGFAGGPKTHGQKNRLRAPGSIGHTAAQRVVKGKRMAGHMGQDRVTKRGVRIVGIEVEHSLILVKGPVPGGRGTVVQLRILDPKS